MIAAASRLDTTSGSSGSGTRQERRTGPGGASTPGLPQAETSSGSAAGSAVGQVGACPTDQRTANAPQSGQRRTVACGLVVTGGVTRAPAPDGW